MLDTPHPKHPRPGSTLVEVRPAAPADSRTCTAWEVVRDGAVIYAASSEAGAMDFAHGLTGTPLAHQRH